MPDKEPEDNIELDLGLSEEEEKVWAKVQEKMQEHFDKEFEQDKERGKKVLKESLDKDPKFLEDPIHKRKVTDFPREIRMRIFGEVSSANEKGQLTSVEPLVDGYIHIPVPAKCDIQDKIDQFRNTLEKELQDLAESIHFVDKKNESK